MTYTVTVPTAASALCYLTARDLLVEIMRMKDQLDPEDLVPRRWHGRWCVLFTGASGERRGARFSSKSRARRFANVMAGVVRRFHASMVRSPRAPFRNPVKVHTHVRRLDAQAGGQ